jgi:hypothetical protein
MNPLKGTVESHFAQIEQAALACMAKVSFTPAELLGLIGMALVAGIVIGAFGAMLWGRRQSRN